MNVSLKTMAIMTPLYSINSQWQKISTGEGDLMDRLTGQKTGFEIGETEKKCGKW